MSERRSGKKRDKFVPVVTFVDHWAPVRNWLEEHGFYDAANTNEMQEIKQDWRGNPSAAMNGIAKAKSDLVEITKGLGAANTATLAIW